MSKILVSPVAFNEYAKLKRVIERFIESSFYQKADFIIIDDGSTDATPDLIQSFSDRAVRSLRHHKRRGVGAAIRTAIEYALTHQYDALVIMAGNDKDDPQEISRLIEPIEGEGFDIVQGSRYLKEGGHGGDMPLYRKWATRFHPILFSFFTHQRVTDTTNGFRAMRLSLFRDERMNIRQPWLDHYELEPYILFKALTLGYKYKEVPVTKIYPPKKLGYTKMKPVTGWWSILKPVIYLGLGWRK